MDWTDKVCLAAFHNRENAQRAVHDLEKNGFDHKQVGIVHRDERAVSDEAAVSHEDEVAVGRDHGAGAAVGAGSGAVLGTIVGAAAAFVFPPVGLVVVAGALLGLATGAVTGGVLGALTGMGIPKETADHYQREFEAGRAIVVVMCEGRTRDALAILRNHGGYQLDDTGQVIGDNEPANPTRGDEIGTATAPLGRSTEGGERVSADVAAATAAAPDNDPGAQRARGADDVTEGSRVVTEGSRMERDRTGE